jgi:ATP-dependent DNA helicase RecG
MTDIERQLLEACSVKPRSAPDMLQLLGYDSRAGNFRRALGRLLRLGCLEMTLPGTPRSKNQRYRITGKGRECLARNGT